MIETVTFHQFAKIYHGTNSYRRSEWFYNYPKERVMILSQHKTAFTKLLSVNNFVRCYWFLEIGNKYKNYSENRVPDSLCFHETIRKQICFICCNLV